MQFINTKLKYFKVSDTLGNKRIPLKQCELELNTATYNTM